jgi:hypothetical protein
MKALRFGAPLLWLCNDGNDAPPGMVRTHFQNEFRRRAKARAVENPWVFARKINYK